MSIRPYLSQLPICLCAWALDAGPSRSANIEDVAKNLRNLAPAQRKAVVEDGAQKEGEVVWYTSMSSTDFPK